VGAVAAVLAGGAKSALAAADATLALEVVQALVVVDLLALIDLRGDEVTEGDEDFLEFRRHAQKPAMVSGPPGRARPSAGDESGVNVYAPRRPMSSRLHLAIALTALTGLGSGCQPKIGDACRRSTDCSLQGERICDLSKRVDGQGECIIEGCGRGECPDESTCVKVYGSDFLTVACDPDREDRATVGAKGETLEPLDACLPHEACLQEGLCADELSARTSCRKKCSDNGDCRGGYECTRTGSSGIYLAPDLGDPNNDDQVKICTPTP
jgi:hypothetical protein